MPKTPNDTAGCNPITICVENVPRPRLHYLHTAPRNFARRVKAIAQLLEQDCVFATLNPRAVEGDTGVRLSIVSESITAPIVGFVRLLRRNPEAKYCLRLCSRAKGGQWMPHVHGLIAGVAAERLEQIAHRFGLEAHLEHPENALAIAKYILSSHQAKPYDRAHSRTYWART